MTDNEKKISRLLKIPGVLNWARQNHPRLDDTRKALEKLANAEIQVSLSPIYSLCARMAYREISYEEALAKAQSYEGRFYRDAALEIVPLFQEYLEFNQAEAIEQFKRLRIPFPIGKNPEGKVASIPVRPTFVTIRDGRLLPVFLLGWVNSPLTYEQCRLISAIIRRALLTQQDFLGSDAEIVTFARKKKSDFRYRGGWLISAFQDLSEAELTKQIETYNQALELVLASMNSN